MNRTPRLLTLAAALMTLLSACDQSGTTTNAVNPAGMALLEVAEQGDLSAVEQLLARHRQPNVRDSCDWTPLMKAALNGHEAVVARLIQAGAKLDATDSGGYTAVMLAASNNHAEVVDLLLKHGATVDHQEQTKGWTALIWAAKQGHVKSVETLLAHRADRTLKDFEGKTAADWARESGQPAVMAVIQ